MGIKSLGITETVIPLAAAASWQRAASGSRKLKLPPIAIETFDAANA